MALLKFASPLRVTYKVVSGNPLKRATERLSVKLLVRAVVFLLPPHFTDSMFNSGLTTRSRN